jgi:hypothetical protein
MIANVWILDPSTAQPTVVALDPIHNVISSVFDPTNTFFTITTQEGDQFIIPVAFLYRAEFLNA